MRLSQLVLETQVALDSVSSSKWSQAQIGAALNSQLVSMIRKMTETDEAYHSHIFTRLGSSARQVHSDRWAYQLPLWVMKISEVRQLHGSASAQTGPLIDRASKFRGRGWYYTADNEITLRGWSQAVDLEFAVAKLPARMTKGTLGDQAGVATNQVRLDPDGAAGDATDFPHESVADAYAGALLEIVGPASARVGQVLRVLSSAPNTGAGLNQHLLTMEAAWPSGAPVVADRYELHAEVPGEHSRLIVLLATRTLLSQQRNLEGVRIYAPELSEQWSMFLAGIRNRDVQQPHVIQEFLPTLGGTERLEEWPYQVEIN